MSLLHKSDLSDKPIDGQVFKIQVAYYRSDEEVENLLNELVVSGKINTKLDRKIALAQIKEQSKIFRELEISKEEYDEFKAKYFNFN
jgi:hypothetical protein